MLLEPHGGVCVDVRSAKVFYRDHAPGLAYWGYPFNRELDRGWKRQLSIHNVECIAETTRGY